MKSLPAILVIVLSSAARSCGGSGPDSAADSAPDTGPSGEVVVTAADPQGWTNHRDTAGDGGPCAGIPRAGSGSLCLAIDAPSSATSPAYGWALERDLGRLSDLEAVSVDLYRASSSTAAAHFAPAVRLFIEEPATGHANSLVWEAAYNGYLSGFPEDSWQSLDIGDDAWWQYDGAVVEVYDRTLTGWGYSADARVVGVSLQLGSGWDGSWEGYADLLSVRFAGVTTTWNFE